MPRAKTGFDPKNVKVKKVVALPVLSVSTEKPTYVKFAGPIATRTINEGKENERSFQFAQVTELESGELMNMNIDNGLMWALEPEYPDESYVGCAFEIQAFKEKGRRFPKFKVSEIEA